MKRMHVIIKDEELLETGQTIDTQISTNEIVRGNGKSVASGQVTMNDPESNPSLMNMENGGASVIDDVAPSLDIDAIIQSFIREQQTGQQRAQIIRPQTTVYPAIGPMEQWLPSASYSVQAGEDMNTMGSAQGRGIEFSQNISYDANFGRVENLSGGLSVDDMLFGFNSSAMEGIGWEFENGSQ